MKILGIDPGTTRVGFACIERSATGETLLDYGCIETAAAAPLADKLTELRQDLERLIVAHKPDCCVIERLFFAKNKTTALAVAHARGVLLETMRAHHVPIQEMHPNEVKVAVTGHGNADKKQVQKMIMLAFRLAKPPRLDDVSDAIAIALAGSRSTFLAATA